MTAKRMIAKLVLCALVLALTSAGMAAEEGKKVKEKVDGKTAASMQSVKMPKQFYEARIYETASLEKRDALIKHLEEGMIPALNRLGVKQVGVWVPLKEKDQTVDETNLNLYVVLVHKNLQSAMTLSDRVLHDKELWKICGADLNADKKDPLYKRVESTMLGSFSGIPKLEAPKKSADRIYQWRQYESHSIKKGKLKKAMFNDGELPLFRKTGLAPVFFGEALIGPRIPSLIYMVSFENADAQAASWEKFKKSPEWKAMSSNPKYKDTVSNITNIILKAAPCSQI